MCPSRVAVNAANRKEIAYRFTEEVGDVKPELQEEAKPKLEISYEDEVKPQPEVDEVDAVDKIKGEATVDAISVKAEPL